ncbi:MAG: hypothetical protein IT388_11915, partial [Nitrospirales bacterium]|nr:hypothetical protein [Nitrospirales bacterium]
MATGKIGSLIVDISANIARLQNDMRQASGMFRGLQNDVKSVNSTIEALPMNVAKLTGAVYVATQAAESLVSTFKKGFTAVDDYKTGVASTAAVVLSFMEKQKGQNIEDMWKQARDYAASMVPFLEKIAAKTLLSGKQTMQLNTEFAKAGVFFDATNQKAVSGFVNISNALAVMTKGQDKDRQIATEIRALMSGRIDATASLGRLLKAMDPDLENHLKLWQEQGVVMENVGALLKGFGPATTELEKTWEAVSSTVDTFVNQILRAGMMDAYDAIIASIQSTGKFIEDQGAVISDVIYRGWLTVKGAVESVWNLLEPFVPFLKLAGQVVGMIASGLGLIAATILPPLTERIGYFVKALLESVALVANLANAFWKLLQFDFAGAAEEAKEAKKNWELSGQYIGKAFADGFGDEVNKRLQEYDKKLVMGAPLLKPPKANGGAAGSDATSVSAAASAARQIANLNKQIQDMIDKSTMTPTELIEKQAREWVKAGADIVKVKEWEGQEKLRLEVEYQDKADELFDKGLRDQAERIQQEKQYRQQALEAELNYQNAVIETMEKLGTISVVDAIQEKLENTTKLLKAQEEALAQIDSTTA